MKISFKKNYRFASKAALFISVFLSLFGMILAVHLGAAIVCLLVFIPILLLTRYVSLSSIVSGFTFPLSMIFIFQSPVRSVILYGMCICVLVLITHQKNIERLLKGKESKVDIFQRKNRSST